MDIASPIGRHPGARHVGHVTRATGVLAVFLGLGAPVHAQREAETVFAATPISIVSASSITIRRGDRVRLRQLALHEGNRDVTRSVLTGPFQDLVGDTVFVAGQRVQTGSIEAMEVSIGRQPSVARDATIGLLVGVGIGVFVRTRQLDGKVFQTQAQFDARRRELTLLAAAIGATGLLAGGLVGKRGHERWITVDARSLQRR